MQEYIQKQKRLDGAALQNSNAPMLPGVGNQSMLRLMQGMEGERATGSERQAPEGVVRSVEAAMHVRLGGIRMVESPEVSALGAKAYAQGDTVHFAPGQFRPGTEEGRRMIGHELAHIVQQRQGHAKADGAPVLQDAALERSADAIGAEAASFAGGAVSSEGFASLPAAPAAAPAQGIGNPFSMIKRKWQAHKQEKEARRNAGILATSLTANQQKVQATNEDDARKAAMASIKTSHGLAGGENGLRSLAGLTSVGGEDPAADAAANQELGQAYMQAHTSGGQNVQLLAGKVGPAVQQLLTMDMGRYKAKSAGKGNFADASRIKKLGGDVAQLLNDFPQLATQLGLAPEQRQELKNRTAYMGAYYAAARRNTDAYAGMTPQNMAATKATIGQNTKKAFSINFDDKSLGSAKGYKDYRKMNEIYRAKEHKAALAYAKKRGQPV